MNALEFFSPEAGQRRRQWLESKLGGAENALRYYFGPTGVPDKLEGLARALEFTDAGDMVEAGRASRNLWNSPSWEAATDYLVSGTALAVPFLSAKLANEGVDVLGSAVDDFMTGYDPSQLNAGAVPRASVPFDVQVRDDGGGLFRVRADGREVGHVSIANNGKGDFVSASELFPGMTGKRIGHAAYDDIEEYLGRELVPSPLGLSVNARAFWKRRLADKTPEELQSILDRAIEIGEGYGLKAEDVRSRVMGALPEFTPPARNPAATRGQEILDLLSQGRASEVTDDMLDMGDPVLNAQLNEYLWKNYDLPMDEASRMARAEGIAGYHGTRTPADILEFQTGTIFDDDGEILVSGSHDPNSFLGPHFASTPGPANRFAAGDVDWTKSRWAEGDGAVYPVVVRGRQSSVGAEGEIEEYILRHGRGDSLDLEDLAADFGDEDAFWDRYDSDEIFRWKNNLRALNRERSAGGEPELAQELAAQAAERYAQDGTDIIHYPNAVEGGDAFVALPSANIRSRFARFDPRLSHLRNLNAGLAGIMMGGMALSPSDEAELEAYLGGI